MTNVTLNSVFKQIFVYINKYMSFLNYLYLFKALICLFSLLQWCLRNAASLCRFCTNGRYIS